ncbi:MAG: porphobilinogen synthase [Mobiluncus porci]|uniref:porphobilinogen synthase n=1 Tax=Mobiluncus porci TaxID=2652278 RepID=UPI0023EFC273|nr:porphobilinogen synthase [Mobiluncus porci]MDD7540888.1 porphobilinogen synthase [Mobiluncus porci]MDY5748917.1 porphobilinogen synthase [Mobiluncus porci]
MGLPQAGNLGVTKSGPGDAPLTPPPAPPTEAATETCGCGCGHSHGDVTGRGDFTPVEISVTGWEPLGENGKVEPARKLALEATPVIRPRRLRRSAAMRRLVAETRWSPEQLVLPVFVRDGISSPVEIPSMPGQFQHTPESLAELGKRCVDAGVGAMIVFGVPRDEDKDFTGSAAWDAAGIQNRGISALAEAVGDELVVMSDTCLDETTSHGHCGPLRDDGSVDNDWAVSCYAATAVSQARAGATVVAPSGMMDGQVRAIRMALDDSGFEDVAIMAYSAKYASGLFGPFRDAVGSSLVGDRRTYQQDPANRREGMRETLLDLDEGADIVMVKPASLYLDVLADVAAESPVPVAAYQVSGEYAMIEAAAANGWIDRARVIDESLTSIIRAGADLVLTYYALEAAEGLA